MSALAAGSAGGLPAARPSTNEPPRPARSPGLRFRVLLLAGALLFGALAGLLATAGRATHVLVLAVVLIPVAVWKRPSLAPALLLGAALLIEQSGGVPAVPITQRIPLFQAIGPGHLQGADMLLLLTGFVYLIKRRQGERRWWPHSHVSLAIWGVLGAVLMAIVIGQLHHGSLRVSLMEARPYVYLAATYFLTAVLVTNRRALRALLWVVVGCVGFKALQGIYVWYHHHHDYPRPESFVGHEASYFFVIYLVLLTALWFFDQPGRLRRVATWLLPLVMFCDLINDRRAAWEMLGGAVLAFGVIAYRAAPMRRRLLGKAVVVLLLVSAVYFPVMWNKNDTLAQPARAIRSQIHPSARDASSDLYRVQENANLRLNIKQGGPLGKGFGVPIDYALPITDISSIDPLIAYIPHNDVLDVMMRMGVLGSIAMWFVIGAGIIGGARLARSADREVAVIGIVAASALVAYALMAGVDQGFFMFRIAFVTGALLGSVEAARRLERQRPAWQLRRPQLRMRLPSRHRGPLGADGA